MQSVSYESTVNVSRAQAWEYLRDLSKAHYYVPGVEKTRIDTQQTEGVGTSRTVFMKNMKPLEETVIEWNDGHGFVLNLHRNGQAMEPFEKAEFVYAVSIGRGSGERNHCRARRDRWVGCAMVGAGRGCPAEEVGLYTAPAESDCAHACDESRRAGCDAAEFAEVSSGADRV